uniref:U3 small nucleolar RNA-associated protein 15 C-terminal domain-containing protein n=1 Tax=Chromera velia CCMP2878 TaxID=1169474 RepID=A0A0G4GM60_9ALVE|eukprot:Cvel_22514.t1-p1 / transcript=Cvel_22514.t1 / gene=Cvel_22514 / organism=Chromera_velia_CCMP2878 / gene_product=U3 small nucleolar RNA-associated protein 15, putative / transcript_product=U3 small nucleolar RNA-associated protein 15, putative / location=Cvel_scaffold2220:17953-24578(-) / protein_length=576 / sequence_SO=supercontig / SO=protein_coding / is_pseudo=false
MDSLKLHGSTLPRKPSAATPEKRFWSSFERWLSNEDELMVTCIAFVPPKNVLLGVMHSTRIDFVDVLGKGIAKTYTRFKDVPRHFSFRKDGRAFVASDNSGLIQLVDFESRAALRRFKGHTGPVHSCCVSSDFLRVISVGDDQTLRVWDLSSGMGLLVVPAHRDHVRSLVPVSEAVKVLVRVALEEEIGAETLELLDEGDGGDLFWTGGGDGLVKLWQIPVFDSEEKEEDGEAKASKRGSALKPLLSLDHKAPVSGLAVSPSGDTIVTAGGPTLKIWSLTKTGTDKFRGEAGCHSALVSGVVMSPDGSVVISAALDQSAVAIDLQSLAVLHVFRTHAPCTGIAVAAAEGGEGKTTGALAIGLQSGWAVRARKGFTAPASAPGGAGGRRVPLSAPMGETRSTAFLRGGKGELSLEADKGGEGPGDMEGGGEVAVRGLRRPKLTRVEHQLKKFQYREALKVALAQKSGVYTVYALLDEFSRRGALPQALRGAEESTALALVDFMGKQIGKRPERTRQLLEILWTFLETNGWISEVGGETAPLMRALKKVENRLMEELSTMHDLETFVGFVEMIGGLAT